MPMIEVVMTVECPKYPHVYKSEILHEKVTVKKCVNCPDYGHMAYRGTASAWLKCKYGEYEA